MSRKLYIRTFGCQMNEYDSAKMADVLHAAEGLAPTSQPDDADIILVGMGTISLPFTSAAVMSHSQ